MIAIFLAASAALRMTSKEVFSSAGAAAAAADPDRRDGDQGASGVSPHFSSKLFDEISDFQDGQAAKLFD